MVLGRVQSVQDPENLARVEVSWPLNANDDDQIATGWAPVATPFAGANYGALMLPNVSDVVVISFLNGDARQPVILGSVWTGEEKPPETPGGDETDIWSMTGRAGTRMAIVEESGGQPKVEITTPGRPRSGHSRQRLSRVLGLSPGRGWHSTCGGVCAL